MKIEYPVDTATLAYIWEYPLVIMKRMSDFSTNLTSLLLDLVGDR